MTPQPRRLDRRAQERAGRALAVGAGDVEHGRQSTVRIAEPGEQLRDTIQSQHVCAGGERP